MCELLLLRMYMYIRIRIYSNPRRIVGLLSVDGKCTIFYTAIKFLAGQIFGLVRSSLLHHHYCENQG